MNTKEKTFDAVHFMREQRDKLSTKLSKMTPQEVVAYFRQKQLDSRVKPSA